jgi:hypothetical protein
MVKSVTESLWQRSAERFQRGVGLRHDAGAGPVGGLGYTVTGGRHRSPAEQLILGEGGGDDEAVVEGVSAGRLGVG